MSDTPDETSPVPEKALSCTLKSYLPFNSFGERVINQLGEEYPQYAFRYGNWKFLGSFLDLVTFIPFNVLSFVIKAVVLCVSFVLYSPWIVVNMIRKIFDCQVEIIPQRFIVPLLTNLAKVDHLLTGKAVQLNLSESVDRNSLLNAVRVLSNQHSIPFNKTSA